MTVPTQVLPIEFVGPRALEVGEGRWSELENLLI